MITSNQARIDELVTAGHWSTETTLHGLLEKNARERPVHLAVKDQPTRMQLTGDAPVQLTWAQLDNASEHLAMALELVGVTAEDRVMVQLPNIAELLVVYYALSKLGAIVSPVPVQYGRHELQHLAGSLASKVMITLENFRDQGFAHVARDALPEQQVLSFGRELVLNSGAVTARCTRADNNPNRTLTICWTSGTTGTPKGVPRSHNMWLATARRSMAAGDYVTDDILLNPFPLVNMAALGGFLFPSALLGCTIVLHHPLDVPVFLKQIQDENITFTIAPPALLNQLAKSPEMWGQFDFSALRGVGSGSAPLAPWMIEIFGRDFGKEVVNFYGSNEGISLFSTPETAPDPAVRASMFCRPDENAVLQTKVADPETGVQLTELGARGELLISGATVFDGYFAHDNMDVFTADGFFRTGDLVEICGEDSCYYQIVGRCKDIINRGGVKISPAELDVVLEQLPGVVEAAVCAFPDERLGEKICACVVLDEKAENLDLSVVQDFLLAQGLAKFKLPERIETFEALPRNALGKVQRFSLQDIVTKKCKEEST